MYHKSVRVVALALIIVLLMSVSVFAGADISDNYVSSSAIYSSAKEMIATAENQSYTISEQLDRASTFYARDRKGLLSADGIALPSGAAKALAENRKGLLELIVADGIDYKDYIKTLTVRISPEYALDYGTLQLDRSVMEEALAEGFTDIVFANDLFALRLSMVDYLPTVPETVTTVKFFVGETRTDVPQAVLDKANSMPILVVREYQDGTLVSGTPYTKNAVALIVNNAMYHVSGRSPAENLFFKYDLNTNEVSPVSGYIYSNVSATASFAKEDGTYFLFLPNELPPVTITPDDGGNGGNGGTSTGSLPKSGYTDVPDEHWAAESIRKLSQRGVISGVGNNLFEPESFVTREQFAKLLAVGFGLEAEAVLPFTDVPQNDWAYPYVARVYQSGITLGIGNNLFGYGAQITRQDMAVMLYKAMTLKGTLDAAPAETLFVDDASIADYARDAVYAMRTLGIINGNPDGTFCPNDSATRAQAAKMLCAAMGI